MDGSGAFGAHNIRDGPLHCMLRDSAVIVDCFGCSFLQQLRHWHIGRLMKRQKTSGDFSPEVSVLAPRPGFEPGTYRLTAGRSTVELSGIICFFSSDEIVPKPGGGFQGKSQTIQSSRRSMAATRISRAIVTVLGRSAPLPSSTTAIAYRGSGSPINPMNSEFVVPSPSSAVPVLPPMV